MANKLKTIKNYHGHHGHGRGREHGHELIITVVNRGFTDDVVKAIREAGAIGGTVLYARSAGPHEVQKFFKLNIEPEKEVILTVVSEAQKDKVMMALCKEAGLTTEARGMSFALPVDDVRGIRPDFDAP